MYFVIGRGRGPRHGGMYWWSAKTTTGETICVSRYYSERRACEADLRSLAVSAGKPRIHDQTGDAEPSS